MSKITEKDVTQALSGVQDPELKKDLVALQAIKNVKIEDGKVGFTIELMTPAHPRKVELEVAAREAVAALDGVESVDVEVTAVVPAPPVPPGRQIVPDVKHTIAVASGKGGVGKSTVSVNLAIALANTGATVGLLDADIYGPNIPIMLGLRERPQAAGNKLLPLQKYGISVMSIGFLTEEESAPVIWRGPLVGRAIQQFLVDVAWGGLDYLLIDLPPGTGDAQLTLTQSVPLSGAIIVSTPQSVALADVTKGIGMFQKVEVPILGVVENMSYFICPNCNERHAIFGHGGAEATSHRLDVPFLGRIPLQTGIREGGDAGTPAVITSPESEVARAFAEIAGVAAIRISAQQLEDTENEVADKLLNIVR